MRITPVTGDLPALATAPPPPLRSAADPPPAAPTTPVAPPAAADADAGARSGDRRPPAHKPFFDPPLIAQRAVLGLPTGFLIADFARSQDIPFAVAAAAVDRAMPPETD